MFQKGLAPIVIVLLIAAAIGGYLVYSQREELVHSGKVDLPQKQIQQTQTPEVDETANWQKHGSDSIFTFKYPPDWVVSTGEFTVLLPKELHQQIQSVPSKRVEENYPREKYSPITMGLGDSPPIADENTQVTKTNIVAGEINAEKYLTKYTKATSYYPVGHEYITVVLKLKSGDYLITLYNIQYKEIFDQIISTIKSPQ